MSMKMALNLFFSLLKRIFLITMESFIVSFVALEGRMRASILLPSWEVVTEGVKNQIWEAIQLTFDVPNTHELRRRWISYAGNRWTGFKTFLTSSYIFGDRSGENPTEKYQWISAETWQEFVRSRKDPTFLERRKKAQEIQAHNDCPHILSRGGYDLLEKKLMAEKLKEYEEASQANPSLGLKAPSPIPRHVKWKQGRIRRTGLCICGSRDSLVEEEKQGTFAPIGRDDILTAATERPEHPGRVRGARTGVGILSHFGPLARQGHKSTLLTINDVDRIKKEMQQEVTQQVTIQVTQQVTEQLSRVFAQQLQDELKRMGLTQQPELHTEARRTRSPTHVSTKGSNAPEDISESDDELSRLYVDTPFHLVAMGKVHNLGPTIHHERIDSGIVRVEVVEVLDASALVPIPSEEVQTVGQAPNQFIQWPKRLVDPHVKEWTNGKDNDNHDEDNASDENKGPISCLLTMTTHLGPQPIELILKEEIVGRSAISLFVGSEEILEICVGNQMLSAVILQVWIMHLHGICVRKDTAHLYGFLDPHTTQDVGNKREDIQTYIMTQLSEGNKECYLLPYYYPNHWQLFVLCPRKNLIVFLCSLGNKPKANIKSTLDLAMQAHQMTKNKRNSKPKWIKPMSRMQRGSFECGYYVMRHMTTIISASVVDSWMEIFNVQDPFSEQDINEIRERWALFFCEATSI